MRIHQSGKPVKVLRFLYRMMTRPEVQRLPHPAFHWLFGLILQWTGYNNAVLEFARKKHGTVYGLGDRKVFERARDDVLKTKLVEVTREGGRNLPTLYALTLIPRQAAPSVLGGRQPPTTEKILGGRQPPMEQKTGGRQPPNWGSATPKENGSHRRTRARLNRKVISSTPRAGSVESHGDAAANSDAGQGADLETHAHIGINGTATPLASRRRH